MSAEPSLNALYDEGREAWKSLELDRDGFVQHWQARWDDTPPAAPSAADLYLASACALRVATAIESFEAVYVARVSLFLARTRPSPSFIAEVQQALRERLFVPTANARGKIHEYSGRGSLEGWVRVVTLRVASNLREQDAHRPVRDERPDPMLADPDLEFLRRRYLPEFERAFTRAVESLSSEHRQLLRMHFIDGLTLEELASAFKMHRATVARRLAAARKAILSDAKSLLNRELRASSAELDSLIRVLESALDISLFRLLG